jgi:hypothetical protein
VKDVGGLTNVLVVIFSLTNYPLANFASLIKAIERLYFARSKDKNLFKPKKNHQEKFNQFFDKFGDFTSNEKAQNFRIINFTNYDYICLYYANIFGKYFCCKIFWSKYKKMTKTLEEGKKRLN